MPWNPIVTPRPAGQSEREVASQVDREKAKHLGNRILAALPDSVSQDLEPDLRHVTLPQGAVCIDAHDPINQVYFPQTGMISLFVATGGGGMVETSSIGREGAVGLQCGFGPRLSFSRAVVEIPGKFSTVSAPRFEQVVSCSPMLRDLIVRYTETLWSEAQQNAACNAIHDGSSRLCRWLLQCADRTGSDQLPLTQESLAEMLGMRRTTVTLLAQQLQNRGTLRYSRGRITVLDRAALQKHACGCYAAIKHDYLPQTPTD
jgi:CRP-like cAMP-binding protein